MLLLRKILSVAFLMFGLYLLQFVFGPSLILCSFHFEFGSLLDLEKKIDNNLKWNFACSLKPQDHGLKTLNEVHNIRWPMCGNVQM